MSRRYVSTILDLITFPTEGLYKPKDVVLIFHTREGEVERPLLVDGEPQFDEEFLDKWIKSNRLEFKTKDDA